MNETPRWGGVRGWVPVSILALAVVVTLAVLALQGGADYDEATPEGVVQRYVQAIVDGEHRAALKYVDPDLGCTTNDLRFTGVSRSPSVRLVGTRIDDDDAEVEVIVSEYAGPFDGRYEFPTTFILGRHDGGWMMVETPWPMYYCEGEADR